MQNYFASLCTLQSLFKLGFIPLPSTSPYACSHFSFRLPSYASMYLETILIHYGPLLIFGVLCSHLQFGLCVYHVPFCLPKRLHAPPEPLGCVRLAHHCPRNLVHCLAYSKSSLSTCSTKNRHEEAKNIKDRLRSCVSCCFFPIHRVSLETLCPLSPLHCPPSPLLTTRGVCKMGPQSPDWELPEVTTAQHTERPGVQRKNTYPLTSPAPF